MMMMMMIAITGDEVVDMSSIINPASLQTLLLNSGVVHDFSSFGNCPFFTMLGPVESLIDPRVIGPLPDSLCHVTISVTSTQCIIGKKCLFLSVTAMPEVVSLNLASMLKRCLCLTELQLTVYNFYMNFFFFQK
jgi:hypothetical protein